MSLKYVKQGTRVEVKNRDDDSPYITTVKEVLERGKLLVDIMQLGGVETRLSTGREYTLRVMSEAGVFKFAATLNGYSKKGHYDYMLFQTHNDGEKIQRRQAFRLPCCEDVEYAVVEGIESASELQKGFIRDISSGGVRLLTKNEIDASQLVQLKLPMISPDFWVYCAILTKQRITDAKYKWQYGIEFIGATTADTEKITAYLHVEQRKLRSRN
jgi:c-di-GMP-binding flagellar brake protein YcgR